MGLTIFYKAQIREIDQLQKMTDEIEDICNSMGWSYHLFDDQIDLTPELVEHLKLQKKTGQLRGISFNPHPSCESVYLIFLDDQLVMPHSIQFLDLNTDPDFFRGAFTKTQFAGPKTHVCIVKLLKYLEEKYLTFDQVLDESGYWDSQDDKETIQAFEKMNRILDRVEGALNSLSENQSEINLDLIDRITTKLEKLRGKMDGG